MKDLEMTSDTFDRAQWLKQYYFLRAAFSLAWVIAAFAIAPSSAVIAATLLIAYPAWDAAANYLDALCSGGLNQNRTQALNVLVSLATTIAVILALRVSMNWVLGIFGRVGDPCRIASTRNGGPALEELRRAMGDGAQWWPVGAGGRLLHLSGYDARNPVDRERRGLRCGRRAVLPGLGGLAHRRHVAPWRGAVRRAPPATHLVVCRWQTFDGDEIKFGGMMPSCRCFA
ncbi:hypothetical protein ACVIG9_002780 [Bradyrhizobium ottawaense]